MEMDFVRQRISELRIKKGISELAMSTELGHSRSYIPHITSGRSNPSVQELLYIIEYLGVTPQIFFTEDNGDEPPAAVSREAGRLPGRAYVDFGAGVGSQQRGS